MRASLCHSSHLKVSIFEWQEYQDYRETKYELLGNRSKYEGFFSRFQLYYYSDTPTKEKKETVLTIDTR